MIERKLNWYYQCIKMTTLNDVVTLPVPKHYNWLLEELEYDVGQGCIQTIRDNQVNGRTFFDLTESELKKLCPLLGEQKAILRIIQRLKPQPSLV